nr:PREDICTED: translation initiation factor IF-2 [Macaca fascicularis]
MVPRAASHATPAWLPIHLSLPISSPVAACPWPRSPGTAPERRPIPPGCPGRAPTPCLPSPAAVGRGSLWSLPCLAVGSGSRVAHAPPALATAPEEGTPRAAVLCPDGCDPGPTPQQQFPALFVGPGSRGHRRPQSWARRRAPGGRACCRAPQVRTGLLHDSCGPGCLGPGAPARSGSEEGRRSPSGEGAGLRLRPRGGDRETTPAPSGRPAPFPPRPRDTGERRRLGYHRVLELTRRGSARRPRSTPGGRRDSDFPVVLKLCPWSPRRLEERSAPLRSRSPHSTDFQGRGGGAEGRALESHGVAGPQPGACPLRSGCGRVFRLAALLPGGRGVCCSRELRLRGFQESRPHHRSRNAGGFEVAASGNPVTEQS